MSMLSLAELVDPASIQLSLEAGSWQEAVRASGEALTKAGVAGASYTEAMIRVVQEHGPYIVIAPGFALAHARPDASVTRTGMSFLRLASPVAFGHESNDPVTLVMALAARDNDTHRDALASLATILSDPARRRSLDEAQSAQEVLAALRAPESRPGTRTGAAAPARTEPGAAPRPPAGEATQTHGRSQPTVPSKGLILTVCGNGVGTSLFLKNTAEQVLDRWGWGPYLAVEATDTISAKGRAKEADFIMTSGAIAQALGDLGVGVEVIEDFTSLTEIDAALRRRYAI